MSSVDSTPTGYSEAGLATTRCETSFARIRSTA
jgi:hypothetical protein